jgi:sigma-B regulation protein RsbU (phosphoserine phosphatase)
MCLSMTKKYTSIRYKIFYILLSISLLSTLIIGGISYLSITEIEKSSIDIMLDKNKNMLQLLVQKQSEITREILNRTEQSIAIITESLFWENGKKEDVFFRCLESMKNNNPYIYNAYIATTDGNYRAFSKDQNYKVTNNYNPLQRPWYQKAISSKKIVWTEVYPDAISGKLMITCSKVVNDDQGEITAVVGVDLTIEDMNKNIINTKIEDSGYAFFIDGTGHLIARPEEHKSDPQWDEIFTVPLGGDLHQIKDGNFQSILTEMINNKKGFVQWQRGTSSDKFIAFDTATSTNWTLGLVISKDDIEQEAKTLFLQKIKKLSTYFTIILGVIIVLVVLISINVSKRITQPIKALDDGAQKIGTGNLDYIIEVKTGNELEHLANQFNKMSSNLQRYINDLETITKQKERIESELNIASRIQQDMLPMIFPPFPENEEIDIFASMSAAKQVGGDFYDFFLINPNTLFFVIGDVSGKGIPASLFMVISKTLIKNEAMSGISPAEVLFKVNNSLNEGNDEMMFVTVLLCTMDLTSGEVHFANGGHNPPLLMRKEQGVEFVKLDKSKILGVFPDKSFSNQKLTLTPGETLFLYTDGVTEAMNPDNIQFSEKQLHKTLSERQGLSVEKIEEEVQKAVKDFVKDAEQSDDITMLVVRYNGKQSHKSTKIITQINGD